MNEQQPTRPSNTSPNQQQVDTLDTSRHEDAFGIQPDDVNLVAAFAKRIGNELYTVDHQSVGGNSNIKALQLDQKKIFEGVSRKSSPTVKEKPVPKIPEKTKTNSRSAQHTPPPVAPVAPRSVEQVDNDILLSFEKRLSKIENTTGALRRAKKIKRGVNYSVSSNGFKGEIKDAELLAEFVIAEVAKGVKTITIRANDSQNSK